MQTILKPARRQIYGNQYEAIRTRVRLIIQTESSRANKHKNTRCADTFSNSQTIIHRCLRDRKQSNYEVVYIRLCERLRTTSDLLFHKRMRMLRYRNAHEDKTKWMESSFESISIN